MSRPPITDINDNTGLVGLGNIPGLAPVASFNIDGINNLLITKGFLAWHYRHCLNSNRETLAGPVNPNQEAAAQQSVIFWSVRSVRIVPQQFRLEDTLTVQGIWGQGTAMFNISGQYLDGAQENVHVLERDIIVFTSDMTDLTTQLFEYNPAGPQRLHYKVTGVEHIRDGHGKIYNEGSDFAIADGKIYWTKTGNKPKFQNGKGDILSIVYWYCPIFVVVNRPHSLRVIPSNELGSGAVPRQKVYAPQLLTVRPSTTYNEDDILGFADLPPTPAYPSSKNVTGGSILGDQMDVSKEMIKDATGVSGEEVKKTPPRILDMHVIYGLSGDGADKKPDPSKILFYHDTTGDRYYDTAKQEWCIDKPAVAEHLPKRPIVHNDQDILAAIANGVMDESDYEALDKSGLVGETPKKLWGHIKHLKQLCEQLESERLGKADDESEELESISGEEGYDRDLDPEGHSGFSSDEEVDEEKMPGSDVISEIIRLALADSDEKIRVIVREEIARYMESQSSMESEEYPMSDFTEELEPHEVE